MTEWSVHEYENWLELESASPSTSPSLDTSTPSSTSSLLSTPPEPTDGHEAQESLTPLFLFSTILPLLSLTNSLPPPTSNTTTSPLSQIDYLSQVSLSRSELLPSSRSEPESRKILAKGSLYLVDSVSRFALNSYRDKNITSNGTRSKRSKGGAGKDGEGFEEEWKKRIEERLAELEGRTKETTTRNELQGSVDEEVEGLRRRVRELEVEKKEWNQSPEKERNQRSNTTNLVDNHSKTAVGGTSPSTQDEREQGGGQLVGTSCGTWIDRHGANALAVCWGLGFGIIISKWIGFI